MTIFIEEEGKIPLMFQYEELIRKTIEAGLEFLQCPYESEVNVLLTSNQIIHEINLEQRGIDKPTDVLSFPMVDWELPCDYNTIDNRFDLFNPETGELLLGDIILSYDKIIEQAKEFGHSEERECSFLIAHSILHLFGYDHMVEEERLEMEELQNQLMKEIGISR